MIDLAINEDLDVYIGPRGDLAFVEGREAFEQLVQLRLIADFHNIIGESDPDTIIEQVRVKARQIASDLDQLDNVALIDAELSDENPNTLEVRIIYDTGEILDFTIGG